MRKLVTFAVFLVATGCVDDPASTSELDQDGIIKYPYPVAWSCTGTCAKYPQRGPTPTLDTVTFNGICAYSSLEAQQVAVVVAPCSELNTTDSSGTTTYWNPYYNGGLADPAYLAYKCTRDTMSTCD
jgi:hypothetical protein